jgi:hypothetical protein
MVLNADNPTKPAAQWPANVQDSRPMANIRPFGMCRSPANPHVAAAMAAAQGHLVPMPCIPSTISAWVPGDPTTLVRGAPALNQGSQATCAFGGVIMIALAKPVSPPGR